MMDNQDRSTFRDSKKVWSQPTVRTTHAHDTHRLDTYGYPEDTFHTINDPAPAPPPVAPAGYHMPVPLCVIYSFLFAQFVIAVALVVGIIAVFVVGGDGVAEVNVLRDVIPQLISYISVDMGDARLQYLDPASGNTSNETHTKAAKIRDIHLTVVNNALRTISPANVDAMNVNQKLMLYTIAVNVVRMERMLYSMHAILSDSTIVQDMTTFNVSKIAEAISTIHALSRDADDYLQDLRTGDTSLPIRFDKKRGWTGGLLGMVDMETDGRDDDA